MAEELGAQRKPLRGFGTLLHGAAGFGAMLVFAFAVVVRVAIDVEDPMLLGVRYATPWPVLAALALGAGLVWWRRWRAAAMVVMVAATACISVWWGQSHRAHRPAHAPTELRIAYWNAARPPARAMHAAEYAAGLGADLLGLGETGAGEDYVPRAWRDRFADRSIVPMSGGMMLIARGRAELVEQGLLSGSGNYGVVAVDIDGVVWKVIVVDLFAQPWFPRQPAFERIGELVTQHGGSRLIVMGDFNTPGDAPATAVLRPMLHDAFESAGRGWSETWPVPLPVLSLDHIWLSPDLRALRCKHGWSWLSDHRAVIATVAVE